MQQAVQRFLQTSQDYQQQYDQLKNILHNIKANSSDEFRLALQTKEGVHYLWPAEIVRCEADGNYTRFFMENGKSLIISKTLAEYDSLLSPHHFIRTHKSHLVNRHFVSYIDHDGFVILKDKSKIEVSRRRKEEVINALGW